MRGVGAHMRKGDTFGEASLTPPELLPVEAQHRRLGARQLFPLWSAGALVPPVYAFMLERSGGREALLAVLFGAVLAVAVAMGLARGAKRYGLSSVPLARAALGCRGAHLWALVRILAALLFGALWLGELGRWMASLCVVASGVSALALPVGRGGPMLVALLLAALAAIAGGVLARRGIDAISRGAATAAAVVFVLGVALVVFAGISSHGFGPLVAQRTRFHLGALLEDTLAAASILLLWATAASDWLRWRKPRAREARGGSWVERVIPLGVVVAAPLCAGMGYLLASASLGLRGSFDAQAIPDAAGFGGLAAGGLGCLFALALWLAAGPLVVLWSPAVGLVSLWPRLSVRRAVAFLTVALVAASFGSHWLRALLDYEQVGLLLAGGVGVLLADELLRRRGQVLLEELYLYSSTYGPAGGVSLAAVVALLLGWLVHPFVWALLSPFLLGRADGVVSFVDSVHARGCGLLLACGGAAGVYLVVRPVEGGLARIFGALLPSRLRSSPAGRRRPQLLGDRSATEGLTSPHFVYQPKEASVTATEARPEDDEELS